jgi:hypothetical protein
MEAAASSLICTAALWARIDVLGTPLSMTGFDDVSLFISDVGDSGRDAVAGSRLDKGVASLFAGVAIELPRGVVERDLAVLCETGSSGLAT